MTAAQTHYNMKFDELAEAGVYVPPAKPSSLMLMLTAISGLVAVTILGAMFLGLLGHTVRWVFN